MLTIYTVGHSNHPLEKFLSLLIGNGITTIADVRSRPFSRRHPQFNKDRLAAKLAERDIAYLFLGRELGARSEDPSHYENGKVQYSRLAATTSFQSGIEQVLQAAQEHRLALMCAEKEPLDCHRTLLVARALESTGASILHILSDGSMESQPQTMSRLIGTLRMARDDMFQDYGELVDAACKLREDKIAHVKD